MSCFCESKNSFFDNETCCDISDSDNPRKYVSFIASIKSLSNDDAIDFEVT